MRTYTQRIKVPIEKIIKAPELNVSSTCDEAASVFISNELYHSLVIISLNCPIAILSRRDFLSQYELPFFAERFGSRPCISFANKSPQLVEESESLDHLIGILTSDDQRYIQDGCVYTNAGRYIGIGLAEDIVRLVTDSRIEASRHLDPLTFLPGSIPTKEFIESLLLEKIDFVVAHVDLSRFKSFNSYYGTTLGDAVIELTAKELAAKLNTEVDFLGHLGGDDFVVVFQCLDWYVRLNYAIDAFNERVKDLYDKDSQQRGGIEISNVDAKKWQSTFIRLNIGVVAAYNGKFESSIAVLSAAENSLEKAKSLGYDIYCEQSELCVPTKERINRRADYQTTRVELRTHS